MTAKHFVNDPDFKGIDKPIKIRDRVWIAAGATILQGIEIGEGAVVAAGSVVNKNVEPFTMVGGIPAKKIGQRNKNLRYKVHSKPSRFL
jgi:maltose O-acetyltransferase